MTRNDIEPLSTREVLKCAMQSEKIASEKYNAIGEVMLSSYNFATAQIFFEAAKVEKGHFLRLKKALKRLYGIVVNDSTPLPFSTVCAPNSGDNACLVDIKSGMQEEDAIRYMEDVERAAEKFYRDAVDKTDRMDMKVLFRTLANEEGRHSRSIRKIARKAATRDAGNTPLRVMPSTMH